MHRRMFSSLPGQYLLQAAPSPPLLGQSKRSPDVVICPLGAQNHPGLRTTGPHANSHFKKKFFFFLVLILLFCVCAIIHCGLFPPVFHNKNFKHVLKLICVGKVWKILVVKVKTATLKKKKKTATLNQSPVAAASACQRVAELLSGVGGLFVS